MAEVKEKRKWKRRDVAVIPAGCATLLSKEQIGAAIGVSDRTLDGMLSNGSYPAPDCRLGAFPRWRVETHNAWVAARCDKPGADAA